MVHADTELLRAIAAGDQAAHERLLPVVYRDLHALAAQIMTKERRDHTLQPTALVHEAFLRLVGRAGPVADRAHFFALAARAMRRVLVDHARARARGKRGGGAALRLLDPDVALSADHADDLLALDEAMERLAALSPRAARVVEMRFFAGLSAEEAARVLDISTRSAEREWRFARAWLYRELGA